MDSIGELRFENEKLYFDKKVISYETGFRAAIKHLFAHNIKAQISGKTVYIKNTTARLNILNDPDIPSWGKKAQECFDRVFGDKKSAQQLQAAPAVQKTPVQQPLLQAAPAIRETSPQQRPFSTTTIQEQKALKASYDQELEAARSLCAEANRMRTTNWQEAKKNYDLAIQNLSALKKKIQDILEDAPPKWTAFEKGINSCSLTASKLLAEIHETLGTQAKDSGKDLETTAFLKAALFYKWESTPKKQQNQTFKNEIAKVQFIVAEAHKKLGQTTEMNEYYGYSARNGDTEHKLKMAKMYEDGSGPTQDLKMALALYTRTKDTEGIARVQQKLLSPK